jgi:hypothetical protein
LRYRTGVLVLVLFAVCVGTAWAFPHGFVNDPEQYWDKWPSPWPYQRNLFMDFEADLLAGGSPIVQPALSGYTDYEGRLDVELRETDWFEWTDLEWWEFEPAPSIYVGVIGIRNSTEDALTGTFSIRIDNTNDPLRYKTVYDELIWTGSDGATVTRSGFVAGGKDGGDFDVTSFGEIASTTSGPWIRDNWGWRVEPNSCYEILTYTISVPAGGYLALDSSQWATMCTPEPLSGLLLLAVPGVVLYMRRRKD